MSYLGGVLGHIAEAELLGHFEGGGRIGLCVCVEQLFMKRGGVLLLLANMR